MRKRLAGLVLGMMLLGAGSAYGQVSWETPLLVPPGAQGGLGLFLMDATPGDLGVLGTWRSGAGPQNLGLRLGLAEDLSNDLTIFGGVDVLGRLTRANSEFPLDIDWVLGAGASIGDFVWLAFPLGLTAGHTFQGDGASFTPFVAPRVILDAFLGDHVGDDLDLDVAVDLGLDLRFHSNLTIRFAATIANDRKDGLAIGVVF